ncbi:MAG TPA: hypothetical protein VFR08_08430 [Candidatus Angelobacter sp.]|nr:hypothetical protein [Candidatus Angelobacter sp.]
MFTGAEWTTISTGAGTVVILLAAGYKWLRKEADAHPQLASEIEKKIPHGVLTVIEDAGKFIEGLAESPFFAGAAAKGKLEAQHVLGKFADSEAARIAAQVLQAFGRGYSGLSKNEQDAAVIMARTELSKLGLQVTDVQIENALTDAENTVSALQSQTIFKAVQDLASVGTAPATNVTVSGTMSTKSDNADASAAAEKPAATEKPSK